MFPPRLGGDDPCWCRSGERYRHCHRESDRRSKVTVQSVVAGVEQAYARAKYCSHPDTGLGCSPAIIRAHTIQRRGGLTRIAEGGKVMDFVAPGAAILKTGRTTARLVGTKEASVFTGFCGRHDGEMFRPLEVAPFRGDGQQRFLLAYRALCKELYERQLGVDLIPAMHDLGRGSLPAAQLAHRTEVERYALWNVYRRDSTRLHKRRYDAAWRSGDFGGLRHYTVLLGVCPDILFSAAFPPRFDFAGRVLQDATMHRPFDLLTCSAVTTEDGGAVVFSWHGDSAACTRFVRSLHALPDAALAQAVVRLAFYSFRELYGRPSWWQGLGAADQDRLLRRRDVGMSPQHSLHPSCYVDDGLSVAAWPVRARDTNVDI